MSSLFGLVFLLDVSFGKLGHLGRENQRYRGRGKNSWTPKANVVAEGETTDLRSERQAFRSAKTEEAKTEEEVNPSAEAGSSSVRKRIATLEGSKAPNQRSSDSPTRGFSSVSLMEASSSESKSPTQSSAKFEADEEDVCRSIASQDRRDPSLEADEMPKEKRNLDSEGTPENVRLPSWMPRETKDSSSPVAAPEPEPRAVPAVGSVVKLPTDVDKLTHGSSDRRSRCSRRRTEKAQICSRRAKVKAVAGAGLALLAVGAGYKMGINTNTIGKGLENLKKITGLSTPPPPPPPQKGFFEKLFG